MNVTITEQAGVCHVMVQGERLTDEEQQRLLAVLGQSDVLDVRLYALKWLSAALVCAIDRALSRHQGNRVSVYNYQTFSYLKELGIAVRLVTPQGITKPEPRIFKALVMGGSADSLEKILSLVQHLPLSDLAVFIVQHILEDRPNLLDTLLRQRTPYRVIMPQNLTPVAPGTLYVAPAGHNMRVSHGQIYLTRDKKIHSARPSIDALFESLGQEYGAAAIGILLCGYGQDGVAGGAALVAQGGELLILKAEECPTAKALVERAKAEVNGGVVVSLAAAISLLAAATVTGQHLPAPVLELFLAAVSAQYGHDYRHYHRDMLGRRLELTQQNLGLESHYDCQREILTNPAAFERLFLSLSINVTAFFRMPSQFLLLREKVLPYLATFPRIKIWVAGCSSGEEVYSLAIVLQEMGLYNRSMIYATDINPFILMQARNGLYGHDKLEECQANYLAAGGRGRFDDYCHQETGHFFSISPKLSRNILFYRHSLVGDGPFNEFQMILCRNLLIYFNGALQQRVMELFDRSLHRDGVLVLGEKESIATGCGERFFKAMPAGSSTYLHNVEISQ